MRRYENNNHNNNARQQASAFRVLSPGRQQLQYEVQAALHRSTIPPPPPRAPEPYKLATPRRSQRKSAFAIIAEPPASSSSISSNNNDRTVNTTSRPTSPTGFPASGRVSPFRGRGFKGPPPRSRSRPHTPPRGNSASSSPRRSLSQIPRPSNNNKVAPLSGSRDDLTSSSRKASPKFGRRAITNNSNTNNNNRYTTSIGSNSQQQQQQPQRNGQTIKSPNKRPSATINGKLKQKAPNSGQEINNKLLRVPPKNLPSGKRFVTANNNNNNNSNNNRINVTPRVKQQQQQNGTSDSSPESPSKIPLRNGNSSLSASREMLNKPSKQHFTKSNGYDDTDLRDNVNKMGKSTKDQMSNQPLQQPTTTDNIEQQDLGLVDLLKQSSSATGTQSVVNTTTTTAVQPLQIDAASILAEAELVAKLSNLEKKQKEMESVRSSDNPTKKDEVTTGTATSMKKETAKEKEDEKGKNGPYTQAMIKHFGPNATNTDDKRTTIISNVQVEPQKIMPNDSATSSSVIANVEKQPKEPESSTVMQIKQDDESKSSKASSLKKASPRNSPDGSTKKQSSTTMTASNNNNNNGNREKRNVDASLQTQTTQGDGSSESLASIRSTDTGVSLNTVRGVSSAKEKTGIHMVKRTEEIETLSGNVVHADSNGERPLVLLHIFMLLFSILF